MNNVLLQGLAVVCLSGLAWAELDIPRSVFRVDQLEEAKAEAQEEGEPLIFVFTDPAST
jgi:hypothetical protein